MGINLTFFGQMIAFAAFVWFCMRYVWPPLLNALEERERKIADSLHAADVAKQSLATMRADTQREKETAKKEVSMMLEQARQQAQQIKANARIKAIEEASKIKAAAREDIENQYKQKQEEIKQEIKTISALLIAKVIGDRFANNSDLDDSFIEKQIARLKR